MGNWPRQKSACVEKVFVWRHLFQQPLKHRCCHIVRAGAPCIAPTTCIRLQEGTRRDVCEQVSLALYVLFPSAKMGVASDQSQKSCQCGFFSSYLIRAITLVKHVCFDLSHPVPSLPPDCSHKSGELSRPRRACEIRPCFVHSLNKDCVGSAHQCMPSRGDMCARDSGDEEGAGKNTVSGWSGYARVEPGAEKDRL